MSVSELAKRQNAPRFIAVEGPIGAGKTSLLAATAQHWGPHRRMAVLVGDIATDRDAQRLAPLVQQAELLAAQGRYGEAVQQYERAAALRPLDAEGHRRLEEVLRRYRASLASGKEESSSQ